MKGGGRKGSGKKQMCGCCVRTTAGVRVRISNRVSEKVKLINHSIITVLPIAKSAHPLFTGGREGRRRGGDQ